MSWNEKTTRDRVAKNDFHDAEVNVDELSRSMDFSNLGPKDARWANTAHLYHDIPNFHRAVASAGADKQKQKKVVRAASTLRKVQGDLLEADEIIGGDDIGKVQLQAARLHAMAHKPYDGENESKESKRVERAVVMAITLGDYIYSCFNRVFGEEVQNFSSAVGIASGRSLIANLGFRGERERISLGSCANLAAKILNGSDSVTITEGVYALLRDSLKQLFIKGDEIADTQTYKAVGVRWKDYPELAKELGLRFDTEKWTKRTEQYRDDLPLDQMDVAWAQAKIDPDALTEKNSRRGDVVVVYADIDKFTARVAKAETNDQVKSLIRELQMVRQELHTVAQNDYEGVAIQHQGDRLLAILNLPSSDERDAKRCNDGLDLAIGMQSSWEHALRERMTGDEDQHLAVGVDTGIALVSRLGKQGKREVICIGPEVSSAEQLQLTSAGKQTRISETIYNRIADQTKKDQFKKSGSAYVADGLTFPELDHIREEAAARSNTLAAASAGSTIAVVTNSVRPPSPPFGGE